MHNLSIPTFFSVHVKYESEQLDDPYLSVALHR